MGTNVIRLRSLVFVLGAVIVAAGCARTEPIRDITASPVPTGRTTEQVRGAIQRAGASLGWRIRDSGPGEVTGTLVLRRHTAVVTIPYNTRFYDIKYKDSVELKSDGEQIHSSYNRWVRNLDNAIQSQLSITE